MWRARAEPLGCVGCGSGVRGVAWVVDDDGGAGVDMRIAEVAAYPPAAGGCGRGGVGSADEVNVTFEGHFGGETGVVAVSGNYAYIGQGQDLIVLDMSSPDSPVELGGVMTSGIVLGVAVSGDYVYVADSSNGLVILRTDATIAAGSARIARGVEEDVESGSSRCDRIAIMRS